ncbi:thymidylate synthase [Cetobacterium sp.]|uniref:thymidylate synthase n=1 Tax=Cetobacterium sp. TaxID=2071632 RepID=UPI003F390C33
MSGDVPLGVPFNTTQYAVLIHLIAQVTGLKPGLFTHVINNAHIYENQVEGMKIQLERRNDDFDAPKLWINPEIKDFYDFTIDDIKLENYEHHPSIKMEVSV